jgi:hypothetical protein
MNFYTFIHVCQTFNFFNFFSAVFKSALNYFLIFFFKNNFLGHLSTFLSFQAKCAKKNSSKKSKNVFSKCVLDFNFVPLKGSVFFSF